ncbi:MAG: hypothetical protein IT373_08630 [Polyangiaceae bacterium]|nr:hypothetical protein [Polyangiaceae bacterium]
MRFTPPVLAVVLGAAFFAGCYPKSAPPPGSVGPKGVEAAQAHAPGASVASLERGRQLFLAHCNACHGYPDVDAVPAAEWPGILVEMGDNAHLTPVERDETLAFVLASRAR